MTTTCEKCQQVYTVGEFPFCPHGRPAANRKLEDVTWPGGKVFENGFERPMTFYSPKEYRQALSDRGMQVRGDGEEGRWATIGPEAIRKATELVERVCQ